MRPVIVVLTDGEPLLRLVGAAGERDEVAHTDGAAHDLASSGQSGTIDRIEGGAPLTPATWAWRTPRSRVRCMRFRSTSAQRREGGRC
jgi:hypothetical protein